MKHKRSAILLSLIVGVVLLSFREDDTGHGLPAYYVERVNHVISVHQLLLTTISNSNLASAHDRTAITEQIKFARTKLKSIDFWLRYADPVAYKKINGPLPVEWETEVFEKFEKPYKRIGAGLTLAFLYLQEDNVEKDSLETLIKQSLQALQGYVQDDVLREANSFHQFYLCNRLYLLNLASVYTTGFECPNPDDIIPELQSMLHEVAIIYTAFNDHFPGTPITAEYLAIYDKAIAFADQQPADYTRFDHFTFIKDYLNPLFALNQKFIRTYQVKSKSYIDYSLNPDCNSIFSKTLYGGQNTKGVFLRVKDQHILDEIANTGRLLFYDPVLSGNNARSCVSCHAPSEAFADTNARASLHFDGNSLLARNTPSLLNVEYNHLLMLDGNHISLQNQTRAVICNPDEMGSDEAAVLNKVLSCKTYQRAFTKFLKHTPGEDKITLDHIVSAITLYYGRFSHYQAPFDNAMNGGPHLDPEAIKGFNLFMGKAQCATCHFIPQFNGVKPPYVGSEFEVLGTPADTLFTNLSNDQGRYGVNPADETLHAFRTGTIRNAAGTKPYMHNGVFNTLAQLIDFYDAGGGAGRGLQVSNQTLSADSLHLSPLEKKQLVCFIQSLNEEVPFETPPKKLPSSIHQSLNNRKVGGTY